MSNRRDWKTLTLIEVDIIKSMAENDLKIANTAKAMQYNRNTIDYHLDAIQKTTGLNPRTFYGLQALLQRFESM